MTDAKFFSVWKDGQHICNCFGTEAEAISQAQHPLFSEYNEHSEYPTDEQLSGYETRDGFYCEGEIEIEDGMDVPF